VCFNPIKPENADIRARLNVDKINMKSFVDSMGAPAQTTLKNQAYTWPQLDPDNTNTLVAVKIFTGRHHQIRAHLTQFEHPVVADGKYGVKEVTLKDKYIYGDMFWFEQYFGRPVVPLFHESGPNRKTERKPAVGDSVGFQFEYPWIQERRRLGFESVG